MVHNRCISSLLVCCLVMCPLSLSFAEEAPPKKEQTSAANGDSAKADQTNASTTDTAADSLGEVMKEMTPALIAVGVVCQQQGDQQRSGKCDQPKGDAARKDGN